MAYGIPQCRRSQRQNKPDKKKIQKTHMDPFEQSLRSVDKQMSNLEYHKGHNPGNTGLENRHA